MRHRNKSATDQPHGTAGLSSPRLITALATSLAMLAFAANSILCRLALAHHSIDAAGFTIIRLASGALMLALLLAYRHRGKEKPQWHAGASLALFIYAIGFSFAYLQLPAGTGALLLFGAVQLSMLCISRYRGERLSPQASAGIVLAFSGLVYLLLPGVTSPPLGGSVLMIAAGVAWGIYTLLGKGAKQPLRSSAWNFIGTLPLLAVTAGIFYPQFHFTFTGVTLALCSGALASALGYVVWYQALPRLTATQAASVQLCVPVIAALLGIALLGELMSWRLFWAALAVLGGIYLNIRAVRPTPKQAAARVDTSPRP